MFRILNTIFAYFRLRIHLFHYRIAVYLYLKAQWTKNLMTNYFELFFKKGDFLTQF